MLLVDLTHTCHSTARTGIQRQACGVFHALARGREAGGVCHDPYAARWRPLEAEELALADWDRRAGTSRGACWSFSRRLRSRLQRLAHRVPPLPAADGFVCPEIFSPRVAAALPEIFARVHGPKVAFFFDTIPLTHPELTPPKTVARFPAYMQELLQFDGVAANSRSTADSLLGYWRWLGVDRPPALTVLPLGVERPAADPPGASGSAMARVLAVGSIEGRKNHSALLGAAEALWDQGLRFELRLIGLPRPETALPALQTIGRLQAAGRPLRFDGAVGDAELEAAWREADFSVYPSIIEGFGLPVAESLARGKPCICTAQGATGEFIPGGGCLGVATPDVAGYTDALRQLLTSPELRTKLAAEARARTLASWEDSAAHLRGWIDTLRHPARAQTDDRPPQ